MKIAREPECQPIIETRHLAKMFGNKHALEDVSLSIPPGGIHAIIGANGAGKSTLFRILLGIDAPTSGTSYVLGQPSDRLTPETRSRIGYVSGQQCLPGWLRTSELVSLHRASFSRWSDETYHEITRNFDVGRNQKISTLSHGERVGLHLAVVFAQQPELLIVDEPTLGLDVVARQQFLETMLFSRAIENSTVIYCSHHMNEVERVADYLQILERGRIAFSGTPDDFCNRICVWSVQFANEPPDPEQLPGLLQMRRREETYQLHVMDSGVDFPQLLKRLGATRKYESRATMESAINAFLSRGHCAFQKRERSSCSL